MTNLELWFPCKPLHINQPFGANADYYQSHFGTNGHMGIDFMAYHGQPVYAPMNGVATYITDDRGGEGVHIISTEPFTYSGGTCWFRVILWHLIGDTDAKFPKPFRGTQAVKIGDLVGYADNTGAPFESSGDHLHMGLVPVDSNGKVLLPANGFNGCIDAEPYFNKYFAADSGTVYGMFQKIISLLNSFIHP